MKTQSLLVALAAAPAAMAHTLFSDFFVDGKEQGDGLAVRIRKDPETATFPLNDLSSNDLACNVDGSTGVSRVQAVQDGAILTFEFRAWPNDASKERLDRGHKGPCAVYLKKVDSAIDDQGHGDGWFKLFDHGYDASTDQWCSDKLIDNDGLFSVKLPEGLKGGYYLARPELLALHAANAGDPQFYASCTQIFLESNGDLVPEETVSIPGYVKSTDDSVTFDIYNRDNSEYTLPGPKVAKLTSSSNAAGANLDAQTSQTEGQRPEGCICENGNWCGKEVSAYSDEKGCWASSTECWNQADKCWDSAGPTGNAGCKIWQDKCQAINDACSAGNFNGPPNKGKDLTPKKRTIDIGLVLPTSGGGVVDSATPKTSQKAVEAKPTSSVKATPTPQATKPANNEAEAPAVDRKHKHKQVQHNAKPKTTTVAVVVNEDAPVPTPVSCPPGYECVTQVHTVTKTEVVYATVYADAKRRSIHGRRHY